MSERAGLNKFDPHPAQRHVSSVPTVRASLLGLAFRVVIMAVFPAGEIIVEVYQKQRG